MKGIILAGGKGTRLYPITYALSKQILPIYNKPMIYYPLQILMMANIREILVISTPKDIESYKNLLGDGNKLGIKLDYMIQETPRGLADAFVLGEQFIGKDEVCLILGDNLFWGSGIEKIIKDAALLKSGARVFGYYVSNPQDFGVLNLDDNGKVIAIEEKPKHPQSHYAIPGLYFYDQGVVDIAKNIMPSARGEVEITAVNNAYLQKGELDVMYFDHTVRWMDTGTHKALLQAGVEVAQLEEEGEFVGAIEATAFEKGYIDQEKLGILLSDLPEGYYKRYLEQLREGDKR